MATVAQMGQTNTLNMKPFTIAAVRVNMAIGMLTLQSASELTVSPSILTADVSDVVMCMAYGRDNEEQCKEDLS